mgnify:FL=1
MKFLLIIPALLLSIFSFAQTTDPQDAVHKPFIKLVEPTKSVINVKASRQFVVGSTCKTCNLTINGKEVKVYPTGAFAYELNLKPGDTVFNLIAFTAPDKSTSKKLNYN